MSNDFEVIGVFPIPVHRMHRKSDLNSLEKKEIEDIIKEGMIKNSSNSNSNNSYIFNGNLKKLKQFCEQQLKIYVEQIINPKKELDFYITQSWLNITKPGEYHHKHHHQNSIISGVFYISTEKDDTITFSDPNAKIKELIMFESKEFNLWNTVNWKFPVANNTLVLFPSWLEHNVEPNEKATRNRISISFNTFVRGVLGKQNDLNQLIL
jgi:uncharacterized protein (TIGR02466 family)